MKTKHTPGPWYYRPEEPSVEAEHNNDTGFFLTVADCGESRTMSVDEQKANARLIAAAPELLEALQVCLWALTDETGNIAEREYNASVMARAAITKSTAVNTN